MRLSEGKIIYRDQMLSVNKKLEMDTVNKHKTALNRDYDKRSVQVNGIAALAKKYLAQ